MPKDENFVLDLALQRPETDKTTALIGGPVWKGGFRMKTAPGLTNGVKMGRSCAKLNKFGLQTNVFSVRYMPPPRDNINETRHNIRTTTASHSKTRGNDSYVPSHPCPPPHSQEQEATEADSCCIFIRYLANMRYYSTFGKALAKYGKQIRIICR
jgi:hypothetical protein